MLRDQASLAETGPFRVASALAQGVDARKLRRVDLETPFHGVRAPAGSIVDLRARCEALLATLDDGVAFSHGTALRLWGVDVPWVLRDGAADGSPVHVTTRWEADRPQRRNVVAHRSRQDFLQIVEMDGLPVTSPAQTFVHVACRLRRPDDVVVLGDGMMRFRQELSCVAELAAISERTKKVKGISQVRQQIPRMRPGTDSVMETLTRLKLCGAGLPEPLVNATITLVDGTHVKRCDLLFAEHRVVVEYDGDQHRTDREQWLDDVRRRRRLEELGYVVVVVVGADFASTSAGGPGLDVVARVRSLLACQPPALTAGAEPTVIVPYRSKPRPLWV